MRRKRDCGMCKVVGAALFAALGTATAQADCKTCWCYPKCVGQLSPHACFGYFQTQWKTYGSVCGPSPAEMQEVPLKAVPTANVGSGKEKEPEIIREEPKQPAAPSNDSKEKPSTLPRTDPIPAPKPTPETPATTKPIGLLPPVSIFTPK